MFSRAARAAVFAIVTCLLAVGAHTLAGGIVPAPVLLVAAPLAVGAGWWATGRQRSGWALGGLVVGAQLVLHLAFVAPAVIGALRGAGGGLSTAALSKLLFCHSAPGAVSAQQVHAAAAQLGLPQAGGTPGIPIAAMVAAALPMLAAHLAAASIAAWWLARGESRVWAAARRALHVLTRRPAGLRPAPRVLVHGTTRPFGVGVTVPCRPSRGPPMRTRVHVSLAGA